ncbi:hypothetical protein CPAV1605_1436 [seawater metagenome]|uniref:N-acetyltransferase domain-containing protein n=1 Tax=seawater metagenome TaxID=1561972 RepID=A0A5E8CKD0_9ZZZZ
MSKSIRYQLAEINYFQYMSFYDEDDNYLGKIVFNEDNKKDNIELIYIFVNEKYRTKNLSSTFYQMFEKLFLDHEFKSITLTAKEHVEKFGKLKKLYQSWGFVTNGKERVHYDGDYCFTKIPMSKTLNENT